jgi:hypothetical protein
VKCVVSHTAARPNSGTHRLCIPTPTTLSFLLNLLPRGFANISIYAVASRGWSPVGAPMPSMSVVECSRLSNCSHLNNLMSEAFGPCIIQAWSKLGQFNLHHRRHCALVSAQ